MSDGNCRDCGALFASPPHKCLTVDPATFCEIRYCGYEAMRDHIDSLSDEELADLGYMLGQPLGGISKGEHRLVVAELVKRFRESFGEE